MRKTNLNILITGAGSGLGRGLSLLLSGQGNFIYATDLNLDPARATEQKIRAEGGDATAHELDVTDEGSLQAFMASVGAANIDVLINNAGFQHVSPLEDFDQEIWDNLVGVILKGTCQMTRAVLPRMRETGFGRIVNIGSIHSIVASAYKTAYVAAKHALLGFSKVVALETADSDITINTICPSYIHTPLVDAQIKSQSEAHGITAEEVIENIMLKPMPKGKFITCEEVAGTVSFLISDAARNITGQTIVIDGGWTIQ
ncbi:MAG: 3-hydroxybutyrate dehydrogenase [Planctomycetota bacterium]|nr:3-hydroxybutyrate dehydrogenase [Planctomycetota bacterium]MDA1137172.1 3-hydroxybutyrate dehydrogenase [Planctomycetota bacterium]